MLVAAGIEVIASTGTDSPDGNGEMSLFNAPALSATGQLAFISQLSGTAGGTSDNLGLYRSEPGGFTQIVRSGSSTLNGMTVTTFFPASPWIDANGTVVSTVGLGSAPVQIHTAVGDGGPLTPLVVPGSSSPSGNNTLLGVQSGTVNDMGAAVFTAIYSGDNPELGLYVRAVDGTITTRLLRNATAPRGGMITGVGRATINESAQVATIASVDAGTGAVSSALRIDGAIVHELARQGDLAVDGVTTLAGVTSSSPLVNDGGQLAFAADYTQPGISRRGVFIADDASLRLLAPGLLPGSASAASDLRVAGISSSGTVGFWAEMGAGIDPLSGIYVADAVGPTLVALEDTLIPSGGKYFRRFFTDAVSFSDGGHLAFLAELSDTVNGAAAGRGLFYYDAQKGLLEIAKSGDSLLGSAITNTGVLFYGSAGTASLQTPDTSLSGLNKLGQVGFGFALADAQAGVAVWTTPSQAADFDEDGDVDGADLTRWQDNFAAGRLQGDADNDADVDGADFLVWQRQLGGTPLMPAAFQIPEAGAIAMFSMAGVGVALCCRRRR